MPDQPIIMPPPELPEDAAPAAPPVYATMLPPAAPERPLRQADGFDRQLIAEIRILADFVSSRGDTGLAAGAAGKLPPQTGSYADALSKYFDIYTAANSTLKLSADDRSFLTLFRDYLADAASPATSSTIAFSTLTSEVERAREAKDESSGGAFDAIRQAFPLYWILANKFQSQVKLIGRLAMFVALLVAVLSCYIFAGNQFLSHLGDLEAQAAKLWQDRANEEQVLEAGQPVLAAGAVDAAATQHARECNVTLPATADIKAHTAHYKVDVPEPATPADKAGAALDRSDFLIHTSIRYAEICAQLASLAEDWQATVGVLGLFSWTDSHARSSRPDARKLNAGAIVALVNGYVTPLLMGLLGAAAYVLRSYLFALKAKTLHPRDLRAHWIRLGLGVIAGLAVGFFMSPGPTLAEQTKTFDAAVSLTGPALAFLAGYAVEVLFGFLDSMARVVFPAAK